MLENIEFNYLLRTNINNLEDACITSKQSHKICQNTFFWISKFQYDHLPIVNDKPKSIRQWIDQYYAALYALDKAKKILFIHKVEDALTYHNNLINIPINYKPVLIDLFVDNVEKIKNHDGEMNLIIKLRDNAYHITLIFFNNDLETGSISTTIDHKIMLNLLTSLIALDKDIEILDADSDYFIGMDNPRRQGILDVYQVFYHYFKDLYL